MRVGWAWNLLQAPQYSKDPDRSRAARVAHFLVIAVFLGFTLFFLAYPDESALGVVSAIVILGACAISFTLLRKGHFESAVGILVFLTWLGNAIRIPASGGIYSLGYGAGFLAITVLAGLLLGIWGAALTAFMSSAFGLWLIRMELGGIHFRDVLTEDPIRIWWGSLLIFLVSGCLLHFSTSTIRGALSDARREIQERTRVETQLRESEKNYRRILESIQDVFYQVDAYGRFSMISPSGAELLGFESPSELIGQSASRFMVRPERWDAMTGLLADRDALRDFELEIKRRDGRILSVSATAHRLVDQEGEPAGHEGIWRDVTEQKLHLEARLRSEKQYRDIFDRASDAIVIFTPEHETVLEANEKALETYGFTREEFIGMSFKAISVNVAAGEDRIRQTLREGQFRNFESTHLTKDGRPIDFLINASLIEYDGQTAILSINREITDRKQAEERRRALEEQLIQAQKMESVGRLAGGIAHDFNNMLTPILGYGELLLEGMQGDETRRSMVEQIVKAAEHSRDLVGRLLAFARKQSLEMKTLDLNKVVLDLEMMLHRALREDVAIVVHPIADRSCFCGDLSQIQQVILNLAVNAQDAMPEGGTLLIETGTAEVGPETFPGAEGTPEGDYVTLAVTDSGIGMNDQVMARLFEPFFTTKGKGKGTGLGLATVYGIVRQHGGQITVTSAPGEGSTFKIFFPLELEQRAVPEPSPDTPAQNPVGAETILVVEDQQQAREMLAQVLRDSGYKVLEAASQEAAEALAAHENERIDLLLTDVVLPDGSGPALFERVGPTRESMRILFMSGYAADVIGSRGVLGQDVPLIQKPFSIKSVLQKVREVLDRK